MLSSTLNGSVSQANCIVERELANRMPNFSTLGYNFETLTETQLEALTLCLDLDVGEYRNDRPLKADYLYAVERHYAYIRIQAGLHRTTYLDTHFTPASYRKSYIRQILTQHGIKYPNNSKRTTMNLDASELQQLFADNVDKMREEVGYGVQAALNPVMEGCSDNMDSLVMHMKGVVYSSEQPNSLPHALSSSEPPSSEVNWNYNPSTIIWNRTSGVPTPSQRAEENRFNGFESTADCKSF